jgi:hypothetical protein
VSKSWLRDGTIVLEVTMLVQTERTHPPASWRRTLVQTVQLPRNTPKAEVAAIRKNLKLLCITRAESKV